MCPGLRRRTLQGGHGLTPAPSSRDDICAGRGDDRDARCRRLAPSLLERRAPGLPSLRGRTEYSVAMEDLAQVVLVGNSMVGLWCIRDVDSKRLVRNGGTLTLFLLVAWLLALDDLIVVGAYGLARRSA